MMKNVIIDYMRLLRLPAIVGLAITPVAGALSVNSTSLSILAPLFFIGVISKIYGFVMNDYFDVELDKLSPDLSQRGLVKGTITKKQALFIIVTCFFVGYIAIFAFFYNNSPFFYMGLFCIVVADILGFIYNKYGKQLIGSDFPIALSESLFFLFGALMVPSENPPGLLTWVLFLILFNEQLYMNAIVGGLKDADHDYRMNVKNIALASGVRVGSDNTLFVPRSFKIFGLGERVVSSFLVFVPFLFLGINYEFWQIGLLLLIIILLISESVFMLNRKQFNRKELRRLIGAQLITWHPFIPIILVSIVGLLYPVLLVILPLIGYILFSYLMGQKLDEPQM
jgi:4-hydroxybenzoate polyprenyltransferase